MFKKKTEIISRTFDADGRLNIFTNTIVYEDGVEVGRGGLRSWVMPGDDLTNLPVEIQRIAAAEHTPEVIAKYRRKHVPADPDYRGPR